MLFRSAKYVAFILAALASLYVCINGGEYTAIVGLLVCVGITAIATAAIAFCLAREIFREIVKPLCAAIRRAF